MRQAVMISHSEMKAKLSSTDLITHRVGRISASHAIANHERTERPHTTEHSRI